MAEAEKGTVQNGRLVHPMNPERSGVEIKTIRGDYKDSDGVNRNRLRLWEKSDFMPRPDDIFRERLYCIQWITRETLGKGRQETFFASVTEGDLFRERKVEEIVRENLARWQDEGLVPDMKIEPGEKTDEPIRTRGWTHWHQLFSARDILFFSLWKKSGRASNAIELCRLSDRTTKLCGWVTTSNREAPSNAFANQALTPMLDYCIYSAAELIRLSEDTLRFSHRAPTEVIVTPHPVKDIAQPADLFVTDPPYADAINYHEITEFFIAWLRKNPPPPFDQWTWDSRRDLAIKGKGEHFRRDMVAAYSAMTKHTPHNGLQVVMFTHQDAGVWADLGGPAVMSAAPGRADLHPRARDRSPLPRAVCSTELRSLPANCTHTPARCTRVPLGGEGPAGFQLQNRVR
jgi:putative DNA methylase